MKTSIASRLRQLADDAESNDQRYQAYYSVVRHGNHAIVDVETNANVTGRALNTNDVDADPALVRVACALLNLGYAMPLHPALLDVLLAFQPGGDKLAVENLFDSLQVMFQHRLERAVEQRAEQDGPAADELALELRHIVQRHFAYRPIGVSTHRQFAAGPQ